VPRTTLTNLSEVLVQLHDELRHFLESHLVTDAVRRTGDLFLPLLDFHDQTVVLLKKLL
jgi:hypothetical protein